MLLIVVTVFVCMLLRRVWECWLNGGLSLNGLPVKKHSHQVAPPSLHHRVYVCVCAGGRWGLCRGDGRTDER